MLADLVAKCFSRHAGGPNGALPTGKPNVDYDWRLSWPICETTKVVWV